MVCILVDSPDPNVEQMLRDQLSHQCFRVVNVPSRVNFIEFVRRERPEIAVIDRINECPDAALLKIAIVKDNCPEARIVVISSSTSMADAAIVEQGVFYYVTNPTWNELVRIIKAAATAFETPSAESRTL